MKHDEVKGSKMQVLPGGKGGNGNPPTSIEIYKTPLKLLEAIKKFGATQGGDGIDPKTLSRKQRLGAEAELERQGVRRIEIAELFGVSPAAVTKDFKTIAKRLAYEVRDFNPQAFVGWLMHEAQWHIAKAKREGSLMTSWQIIKDFTLLMQSYGLLPQELINPLFAKMKADATGTSDQDLDSYFDSLPEDQFKKVSSAMIEAAEASRKASGEE